MLTSNRSVSKANRNALLPATDRQTVSRRRRPAFTLIELLVVVSIIALLISILLPSLRGAREQARAVVCGQMEGAMGRGIMSYAAGSRDWFPGVNTSGVELQALQFAGAADYGVYMDPDLPVQNYDWLTPILRFDTKLPNNRAERFQLLVNKYSCPSQLVRKSTLYTGGAGGVVQDLPDFEKLGSWKPLSYLMPVYFQYWGTSKSSVTLSDFVGAENSFAKVRPKVVPANWDVQVDNFESNMSRIVPPSGKILFAEGTRFVYSPRPDIDHDITLFPTWFGSFTSSGAWRSASQTYGVKAGSTNWNGRRLSLGSAAQGANLILSYRHLRKERGNGSCQGNTGKLSAAFFDGHVELLSDRESRKIDYWYPKGGIVKINTEGMTDVPLDYVIR